jgi:hypothetical protein
MGNESREGENRNGAGVSRVVPWDTGGTQRYKKQEKAATRQNS